MRRAAVGGPSSVEVVQTTANLSDAMTRLADVTSARDAAEGSRAIEVNPERPTST